jgi:hypothetical protein
MGNSNNSTIINPEEEVYQIVQERRTITFQEQENQVQLIKPEPEPEPESELDSLASSNDNNSKNSLQILYVSPLSYNKEAQENRKRQFSDSLYETRKNKLFNKYENDIRNILSMYKILDKYYNFDYKILSQDNKKEIYEKILIFRTSPTFIDKKIYKNICDYNFQYLAYFYYYLGKSLKILNEIVNNTYNLNIIEDAKNKFIEYHHYLENKLEKQHNKEIWNRVSR